VAVSVQLAETAADATDSRTAIQSQGYNYHALIHVNNQAAVVSLGSSQSSANPSFQSHTLALRPAPQNKLERRAVHTFGGPINEIKPLPIQFPSWSLLSALSCLVARTSKRSDHHCAILNGMNHDAHTRTHMCVVRLVLVHSGMHRVVVAVRLA
jgi:hypothetical protein